MNTHESLLQFLFQLTRLKKKHISLVALLRGLERSSNGIAKLNEKEIIVFRCRQDVAEALPCA